MPRESGFSGPTMVKELFCFANSQSFNKSLESISILFCVPPFPGAKNIFLLYLVAVSIQWNVLSLQNLQSRSYHNASFQIRKYEFGKIKLIKSIHLFRFEDRK